MKPRRLGRGLDFLLQGPSATEPEATGVTAELPTNDAPIDAISPNPWQPRTQFDDDGLAELTASIRAHGVLQPVVVRLKPGGGYELVAGERRLMAAKRVGLTRVPITIKEIADDQMLVVALIENIQRRDLNPVERARGFKRLIDEQQLSHEKVAELAGMARSTVSNCLRLLDLSDAHLDAVSAGVISEGHARALLAEADAARRQALFESIRDQRWNVRTAEAQATPKKAAPTTATPDAARLATKLREKLGTKVRIVERGTRGRIVIDYSSLQEFERLFERLAGEPTEIE